MKGCQDEGFARNIEDILQDNWWKEVVREGGGYVDYRWRRFRYERMNGDLRPLMDFFCAVLSWG